MVRDGIGARRTTGGAPVDIALGLALLAAVAAVAALHAPAPVPGFRGLASFAVLGDLLVAPAFLFIAGFVARSAGSDGWRPRRLLAALAAAALLAVSTGDLLGAGWRAGLAQAAPALWLLALPLPYQFAVRRLEKPARAFLVAVLLHGFGVLLGGTSGHMFAPFIFFVAGWFFVSWRARFERLVDAEPELAAASGPIIVLVAIICIARTRAATPGIADLGTVALAMGVGAGLAALAAARVLERRPAGEIVARLGRATPFVAVAWLPLLGVLLAVADRGQPPGVASVVLFAVAALALIVFVVDGWATPADDLTTNAQKPTPALPGRF
jgi:hypothetical protein